MRLFKIVAVFTFLFISETSFCQTPAVVGQTREKLRSFYENISPSTIHVFFNQPAYAPGDTAYYKIHLISAKNLLPEPGKHVCNLKVFDNGNALISHQRLVITDGLGDGNLVVSETLAPGIYLLVAYSDAMLETNQQSSFYQQAFIVSGENIFLPHEQNDTIQFFPEGGNLIEGFNNKIVITGLDKSDSVSIFDDEGSLVSHVQMYDYLGTCDFTLEKGHSYYLRHRGKRWRLPGSVSKAIGLRVLEKDAGYIKANVFTGSDELKKATYILLMTQRDNILQYKPVSFVNGNEVSVNLSIQECRPGTVLISLLDDDGNSMAERLVYILPRLRASISTSKPQYHVRENIQANINISDLSGRALTGVGVVTVYEEDLFPKYDRPPGLSESLLQSNIDRKNGIFESLDISDNNFNTYLITKKWKTFAWNELRYQPIPSQKKIQPYYFKGRVSVDDNKLMKDPLEITFWLTRNDFIYRLTTKENGAFEFPLFMNFGDDLIIYAVSNNGKIVESASIEVTSSSFHPRMQNSSRIGNEDDPYSRHAELRSAVLTSYNHYLNSDIPTDSDEESGDFADPDFEVDVKKYKPFGSVSEILKEIVPMVRSKRNEGKQEVTVFMKELARFAPDRPFYIIDGVVTDDSDYFLSLDPGSIVTIGVLHSETTLKRYGILGSNGIIAVRTTIESHGKALMTDKKVLSITGITNSTVSRSKEEGYDAQSRIPDLRSCLYWNPNVKLRSDKSTSIEFPASDAIGTYLIRIQGLTDDGRVFEAERIISVGNE